MGDEFGDRDTINEVVTLDQYRELTVRHAIHNLVSEPNERQVCWCDRCALLRTLVLDQLIAGQNAGMGLLIGALLESGLNEELIVNELRGIHKRLTKPHDDAR